MTPKRKTKVYLEVPAKNGTYEVWVRDETSFGGASLYQVKVKKIAEGSA